MNTDMAKPFHTPTLTEVRESIKKKYDQRLTLLFGQLPVSEQSGTDVIPDIDRTQSAAGGSPTG